jgi:hypothetical protein
LLLLVWVVLSRLVSIHVLVLISPASASEATSGLGIGRVLPVLVAIWSGIVGAVRSTITADGEVVAHSVAHGEISSH